jgi:hypothetical protein
MLAGQMSSGTYSCSSMNDDQPVSGPPPALRAACGTGCVWTPISRVGGFTTSVAIYPSSLSGVPVRTFRACASIHERRLFAAGSARPSEMSRTLPLRPTKR